MITIRNIDEPTVELYGPEGFIGLITNVLSFEDVRLQIASQEMTGYYIKYNNQRINIDYRGELQNWPRGLFDQHMNLLSGLITLRLKNI